MSGHVDPKNLPGIVSSILRRLETLEKIRKDPKRSFYVEYQLEFTDGLFTGQETNRYPIKYPTTVTGWRATADTAGSTSTSIQVIKSGSVAETLTIAASTQFLSTQSVSVGFARGDYLQGNVSSPGTGIDGVVVVLECVEYR